MSRYLEIATAMTVVTLSVFVGVRPTCGDDAIAKPQSEAAPTRRQAMASVERGLEFLDKDASKWRREHECSTCHHGIMTVWVLSEAKQLGYVLDTETMKETVQWAKKRVMDNIDKPRDPRPGWKMVSTPAIYLALMAQSVTRQDVVSADELKRVADHLIRHQETDGSWAWSSAPPLNRPPPFFESDEVATRLAYLALAPQVPADPTLDSVVRDSRVKAAAWLDKTDPEDTTQAAALRLLMDVRGEASAETIESGIAEFLRRRNEDGGWGQLENLPSDAYATGQALYVLSLVGVKSDREEIRRAVSFLVDSQRADGSWPMISRAHPGATPYKNPIPITYFGSSWATLGLMRSVPASKEDE